MLVRVALGAATVVVGFLGGVQLHQVVASSGEPAATFRAIDPSAHEPPEPAEAVLEDCPRLTTSPPYPENVNGMTYGSGAGVDDDDPGPDLVAARGANGRCGFIRSADASGQAEADGQVVPLYAQDGVTVIGELHIDSGWVLTSGAPEPARSAP
ncbi:hypothetical protein Pve01_72850 [Planomonospora venezuelensis]|nr:hypothetical protein Pve01_72850 [Planomonospora venezuelensis]